MFFSFATTGIAQSTALSVQTPAAQRVLLGAPLRVQLSARGGSAPYTWKLLNVPLPEGLTLNKRTGRIGGTPEVSGEFRVPIAVEDSSSPPQEARGELEITVISQFEVRWKQPPQVRKEGISGSVIITSNSNRTLQLTVIILALDRINKAFALGYEHFNLKPYSESPEIPFGATLPFGSYIVNVDAIAEEPIGKRVFRSRIESARHLTLQQRP
jgi:hypothetical protein